MTVAKASDRAALIPRLIQPSAEAVFGEPHNRPKTSFCGTCALCRKNDHRSSFLIFLILARPNSMCLQKALARFGEARPDGTADLTQSGGAQT